jgi:hypothetical protein
MKFPHRGSGFTLLGVLGHENALSGNIYVQWIKINFHSSIRIARTADDRPTNTS